MLRLTLSQMRRSLGRLSAAAIAIAIGAAFLAATLIAGGVITRAGYDAIAAAYGDADVVVEGDLSTAERSELLRQPDVAAADPLTAVMFQLRAHGQAHLQIMLPVPSDPRLGSLTVSEGAAPTSEHEIALPPATASSLGVGVGDKVTVLSPEAAGSSQDFDVTGITDDPRNAWSQEGGAGLVTSSDISAWSGERLDDSGTTLVAASDGVTPTELRESLSPLVGDARVLTKDEAAAAAVSELSDGGNVLVTVVLGFAAVAMLVAALVIANTFQVLVAQRTRTLALLRCVGATKRQLRGSVLLEATILGAGAALVGLVAGTALAQGALTVLNRADLDVPLPSTVSITPAVVLVPLLVGTLVTLLASLVPAREATRVAPIAALRPADAPAVGARAGRVRLGVSLLLVLGGGGVLLLASAAAGRGTGDATLLLGIGTLAGALSFVGVLLGAVFWVPRIVALLGRGLASTGTSARIAAANTVRNPRRTAATSTALLIGVTLVVMMSTGAASARTTMNHELDAHYPVDLVVEGHQADGTERLDEAGVQRALDGVDGIRESVLVRTAMVEFDGSEGDTVTVAAVDGDAAASVVRDASLVDSLDDGTLLLPASYDDKLAGDATVRSVTFDADWNRGPDGPPVQLRAVTSDLGGYRAIVTTSMLDQIAPNAPVSTVWVSLDPGADPATVLQDVRAALPDGALEVSSAAAERVSNERFVDAMLGIVVGLLAVAVVIALIGVANTLSLSVLERRRESATLRAIGLSRRQLRWMLALEGMLIAGVGALLGAGLGLLYGWAGAVVVFGNVGDVLLNVPWRDLVLVFLVALVAGLLASVLPGRAAARTSPVAALSVD
ncbi:FtsX-like permease family protein [Cellulomonas sp. URHE0023]|uniref:FtsX-like permease family protein n=1 Tax=Cellulomonas sp. URHE0023 TaxID=1380354 RepID=UPI0004875CE8|nr:FtsX family ABC transporter permease [Cellulomonas sp. URHE0023]